VKARVSRFLDSDAFPRALAVAFIAFTAACLAGVVYLIEIVQACA
jgi:hypothetical protein